MNYKEALEKLNIKEYGERIYNSHSRGELFHLWDYVMLAESFKDNYTLFKELFEEAVSFAESNWTRPESVFQHMPKMIYETLDCEVKR